MEKVRLELEVKNRTRIEATNRIRSRRERGDWSDDSRRRSAVESRTNRNSRRGGGCGSRDEKQNQLPKRKGEPVDRGSKEFQQMRQTGLDQLGPDGEGWETEQDR